MNMIMETKHSKAKKTLYINGQYKETIMSSRESLHKSQS